jgi:two-component system response regulator PilR (NtrC family)
VERAAVLGGEGPLDPQSFAIGNGNRNGGDSTSHGQHAGMSGANGSDGANGALDLKTQVEAVERRAIQKALEASGGNRRQAASLLGISLRTLFYKMRRLPAS